MNYNELTKKLKDAGWRLDHQQRGSHEAWRHPTRENTITIPNHGRKEIGKGLAEKILKEAGLK